MLWSLSALQKGPLSPQLINTAPCHALTPAKDHFISALASPQTHCRLWPPFPPLNVKISPAAHLTHHQVKGWTLRIADSGALAQTTAPGLPTSYLLKTTIFWFGPYFKPTVSSPPEHLPPQLQPDCWHKQPEQTKPPCSTRTLSKGSFSCIDTTPCRLWLHTTGSSPAAARPMRAPLLVCAWWFLELMRAAVSPQCYTTDCSSVEDFSCLRRSILGCWCWLLTAAQCWLKRCGVGWCTVWDVWLDFKIPILSAAKHCAELHLFPLCSSPL